MLKNFRMFDGLGSKIGNGGVVCTYDRLMPIDGRSHIIRISNVIDTRLNISQKTIDTRVKVRYNEESLSKSTFSTSTKRKGKRGIF